MVYLNILMDKVIRENLGMDIDMELVVIGIIIGKLYVKDIGRWIILWAIVIELEVLYYIQ